MNTSRFAVRSLAVMALGLLGLSGCGGGGQMGASSTLSLKLVDGPVTGATVVWIQFVGVEVKPVDGPPQSFDFSPAKGYDLLTLQNGNAATLLGDTTVPAGDYEWIRLKIDPTPDSSYVEDGSGVHGLKIPSGAQSGLKLIRGFTMPAGGRADFTIDFVLDKSIIAPPGLSPQYLMKPVLRMTNNVEVGTLEGTISDTAYMANTGCTDGLPRVYLYEGAPVVPDDIYNPEDDSEDSAPEVDPLVTTTATLNGSGGYDYHIGYVEAGTYTVAFTCDADDAAVDENVDENMQPVDGLNFTVFPDPVVVTAGATATADF
jgi:hypothetical protein